MAKICTKKIGLTKFHSATTVFGKLIFEHCCNYPFKCDGNTFKALFFFLFNGPGMLQYAANILFHMLLILPLYLQMEITCMIKNAENDGTNRKPCCSSMLQELFSFIN